MFSPDAFSQGAFSPSAWSFYTYVEDTRVIVPYLIGMTSDPALRAIADIYCDAVVVNPGGTVVAQSPDAFTKVERGSEIMISMGGPVVKVKLGRDGRGLPPY